MAVEVLEITLGAPEEKGDAIVGARNDQRVLAGSQPHHPIVAESVAHQHGLIARVVHAVERSLETRAHALHADVVESFGEKFHVHRVRRTRHHRAKFPVKDLTGNQLQPHKTGTPTVIPNEATTPASDR